METLLIRPHAHTHSNICDLQNLYLMTSRTVEREEQILPFVKQAQL